MVVNQTPLVTAIVEAILLLEQSPDSSLDPDLAVRGLENMTSILHELNDADQVALRQVLVDISQSTEDAVYASFVASVRDMIGLAAG